MTYASLNINLNIRKGYYDNSNLCAECTGSGCKRCGGKGVTRWPLSQAINNCTPPCIQNPYRHFFYKAKLYTV